MSNQYSDWTQHEALENARADRRASAPQNRLPKAVTPWDAARAAASVRDLLAKCDCLDDTTLPDLAKLNMMQYAILRQEVFRLAQWFREGGKT